MLKFNSFHKLLLLRYSLGSYMYFKKIVKIHINNTHPNFNLNVFIFYNFNLFIGGSVRSFRYIFGLPNRGQRTWSNGKNAFKSNKLIFNLKYIKFKDIFNSNSTKSIFIAEYVNLFLQYQWFFEWFYVSRKIKFLPHFIKNSSFIDIPNILKHNIYGYYKNPFKYKKKKSHRKKKNYPKNKISQGLPFGFSIVFQKNIKMI